MGKRNQKPKQDSKKAYRRRAIKLTLLVMLMLVGGSVVIIAGVFKTARKADLESVVIRAKQWDLENRPDKVVETLGPHLEEFYDRPETLRLFAKSQLQLPSPGNEHLLQVIRLGRRVLELEPDDIGTIEQLVRVYERTGNSNQALKLSRRYCSLKPKSYDVAMKLASLLIQTKNFDEAEQVCLKTIQVNSQKVEAFEKLLVAKIRRGDDGLEVESFLSQKQGVSERLLRIAVERERKDLESVRLCLRSVTTEDLKTSEQTNWLVRVAESMGLEQDADRILQEVAKSTGGSKLDPNHMLLAYRFFQSSQTEKLLEQIEAQLQQEITEATKAELLVLRSLAYFTSGNRQGISAQLSELEGSVEPIAQVWQPVLKELEKEKLESVELLQATQGALKRYPQSCYLIFLQGFAFEFLDETDLAIAKFRLAINLAPRWILPRVALARIYVQRNQFDLALAESSMALQVNPRHAGALDVALYAVIGKVNRHDLLDHRMRSAITPTLAWLRESANDEFARTILECVQLRIQALWQESDSRIQRFADRRVDLEDNQIRLLKLLVVDSKIRESLQAQLDQNSGLAFGTLLEKANRLVAEQGLEAAKKWLLYHKNMPEVARSLALAMILDLHATEEAKKQWLKILNTYPGRTRILELALQSPALSEDTTLLKKLVKQLKSASMGQGIEWKLAEARLEMRTHRTKKVAAKVVLSMGEVIERSPSSVAAYALLSEAYLVLNEKNKMLETLELAIGRGVDRPGFRLVLAREYLAQGANQLAVQHARYAHASKQADLKTREAAIDVLRKGGAREWVAEALGRELPDPIQDTDDHFRRVSAYVIAMAENARTGLTEGKIEKLAKESERWFQLWLDAAVIQTTPLSCTVSWLEKAESWANGRFERLRKVSAAWRRIARRESRPLYWENAIDTLNPTLETPMGRIGSVSSKQELSSYLVLAGMYVETGKLDRAKRIYRGIAENSKVKSEMRAVACNNLASLLCEESNSEQVELKKAAELARKAIALNDHEVFAVTLAKALKLQGRKLESKDVLKKGIVRHPQSYSLQLALGETALEAGEMAEARAVLAKLRALKTGGNEPDLTTWNRIRRFESEIERVASEGESQSGLSVQSEQE